VRVVTSRRFNRFRLAALLSATAVVLGGCSAIRVPTADDLVPQAPRFELKSLPSAPVRRLGPAALVGPDGNCSVATGQSEFAGSGIALQMSECDVVQRAGPPQNIDISATRSGERSVTMRYGGERAGLYRFVSGRLVSIEGAGEPATPERPAKKKPARKSASSSAQ